MNPKCKNCVHHSWTIEGDAWCEKKMHYTNEDGCCKSYESNGKQTWTTVIAIAVLLITMLVVIKCNI